MEDSNNHMSDPPHSYYLYQSLPLYESPAKPTPSFPNSTYTTLSLPTEACATSMIPNSPSFHLPQDTVVASQQMQPLRHPWRIDYTGSSDGRTIDEYQLSATFDPCLPWNGIKQEYLGTTPAGSPESCPRSLQVYDSLAAAASTWDLSSYRNGEYCIASTAHTDSYHQQLITQPQIIDPRRHLYYANSLSRSSSAGIEPPSPSTSFSSAQSQECLGISVTSDSLLTKAFNEEHCAGSNEEDYTDEDCSSADEPYAKLIYRALRSVPGHTMALKEIYEWFERHTTKARNSANKGWQNSIRHNLSMNAAFEGIKPEGYSTKDSCRKPGNSWMLTEAAIKNGVQSTTRYRKLAGNFKKSSRSDPPQPQRQRSGAKGGRASRKVAKLRKNELDEACGRARATRRRRQIAETDDFDQPHPPLRVRRNTSPVTPTLQMSPQQPVFGFQHVIGCAELAPGEPLFYDPEQHGDQSLFEDLKVDSRCLVRPTIMDRAPASPGVGVNFPGAATTTYVTLGPSESFQIPNSLSTPSLSSGVSTPVSLPILNESELFRYSNETYRPAGFLE